MNTNRILGVFTRYFHDFYKGYHFIADLFFWPFVDIILWGMTSVWLQTQQSNSNVPQILMTALIFWQIIRRGSLDISASLLQEFWNRNLMNLFSSPLKISEWSLGIILLGLVKLFITVAFGGGLVYLLYSLNVFTIGWAFLPFTISLVMFGWTIGFLASSIIVYYGHQMEAFAWIAAFIFAPFSAIFYPVSVLPNWAQIISWMIPTTYIFEGMRAILSTGSFPAYFFWMSLLLNFVYLFISLTIFKFMFEKSREKGLARFL
jgi:ABC-2 type transport system permease protein